MKKGFPKIALGISTLSLLAFLILWGSGALDRSGPTVIAFFLFLSIGLRGVEKLKGFSFTVLIFAAVAASMFYPGPFTEIAGFDMKGLIIPLLMIIMFGMGTAMSLKDFAGVIKMPKGVLVGILCQFTIMPFVGLALARLTQLPRRLLRASSWSDAHPADLPPT